MFTLILNLVFYIVISFQKVKLVKSDDNWFFVELNYKLQIV